MNRRETLVAAIVAAVSMILTLGSSLGFFSPTPDQRTAIIASIPALVAVVFAVLAYRVKEVHELVNAKATAQELRISQLERTIEDSHGSIPANPSPVPAPVEIGGTTFTPETAQEKKNAL